MSRGAAAARRLQQLIGSESDSVMNDGCGDGVGGGCVSLHQKLDPMR